MYQGKKNDPVSAISFLLVSVEILKEKPGKNT